MQRLLHTSSHYWTAPTLLLAGSLLFTACRGKTTPAAPEAPEPPADTRPSLEDKPGVAAISKRCQECHQEAYAKWQHSHHGLANRHTSPEQDSAPFANFTLKTPTKDWVFSTKDDKPTVKVNGKTYQPDMALGTDPLIQYLVADHDGRWQTTSAAWDPKEQEWFDVLSGDERTQVDWGHWTNRGMTWNVQCAWCHMTDFHKNYDAATDQYNSTWQEMGVGCTQCHGDLADQPDPDHGCLIDLATQRTITPDRTAQNCASCHSRRGEFDNDFHHGALFADHFALTLPTSPDLYYPDGQVLGEDYVYGSLMLSKMGHKGISCRDCHDSHSATLKLPLENNALCMQCHATGDRESVIIQPYEHSHHAIGSTGSSCVECHMTHTTYMDRDPRRDHGFHIPDPLLTKELGIPNACNKCHTDKDTDWAIKWTDEWYGEKMNRPERHRTRAIAKAYTADPTALNALLAIYPTQTNPAWQATLLQLMQPFGTDPRAQQVARNAVTSPDPMVRSATAGILEFSPANRALLQTLSQDPIRQVRQSATWALRNTININSPAYQEFLASLNFASDQPGGMMRQAQLAMGRNDLKSAESWMKKAITIDASSAGGHESYAVLLSQLGRSKEALAQLLLAQKLQPENPQYPYLLALASAEAGTPGDTEKYLKEAIALDKTFDRAWYNLGLLQAGENRLGAALDSLLAAEKHNPQSPDYPYARATVHYRRQEMTQAIEAIQKALGIQSDYQPALQFLQNLQQR